MQRTTVVTLCDACAATGTETPGEPAELTWNGRTASLDLCPEHAAPLDYLIEAAGGGQHPVGWCDVCSRQFATPQGLSAHQRFSKDHGAPALVAVP